MKIRTVSPFSLINTCHHHFSAILHRHPTAPRPSAHSTSPCPAFHNSPPKVGTPNTPLSSFPLPLSCPLSIQIPTNPFSAFPLSSFPPSPVYPPSTLQTLSQPLPWFFFTSPLTIPSLTPLYPASSQPPTSKTLSGASTALSPFPPPFSLFIHPPPHPSPLDQPGSATCSPRAARRGVGTRVAVAAAATPLLRPASIPISRNAFRGLEIAGFRPRASPGLMSDRAYPPTHISISLTQ